MKLIKVKCKDASGYPGEPDKNFGSINVTLGKVTDYKPIFRISISGDHSLNEIKEIQKDITDAIKFAKSINPKIIKEEHEKFWSSI
jgi:hypothetical protein